MACLEGFEPPTFWFVAKHSIRLSYKHITLSRQHNVLYHLFSVCQHFFENFPPYKSCVADTHYLCGRAPLNFKDKEGDLSMDERNIQNKQNEQNRKNDQNKKNNPNTQNNQNKKNEPNSQNRKDNKDERF